MLNVKFICPDCKIEVVEQADYVLDGVEGFVAKSDGTVVKFVDPTRQRYCTACTKKHVASLLKIKGE